MWQQAENETDNLLFICKVKNFKQYLKAITSMMTHNRFNDDYEICGFDYEQWHTYFGTREVDDECEEYEDGGELTNPCKFKCNEDDLLLQPTSYPSILVWNQQEQELSIFN